MSALAQRFPLGATVRVRQIGCYEYLQSYVGQIGTVIKTFEEGQYIEVKFGPHEYGGLNCRMFKPEHLERGRVEWRKDEP